MSKKNIKLSEEKAARGEYDVFISYNHKDHDEVLVISTKFQEEGLAVFLDEWVLRPGFPWMPELSNRIKSVKSAAVFLSAAGLGACQDLEMQACLQQYMDRMMPVIPVLLPDIPSGKDMNVFLKLFTWVDFRRTDPEPMAQLLWGVTGIRKHL